jgi:hypothetical protein
MTTAVCQGYRFKNESIPSKLRGRKAEFVDKEALMNEKSGYRNSKSGKITILSPKLPLIREQERKIKKCLD